MAPYPTHIDRYRCEEQLEPVIYVNDDISRHIAAGDYVATIEPTRRLNQATLDKLYEETLSVLRPEVGIGVTLKLFQHVRANIEYYVAHFAAKARVIYFCTDRIEDAIRIRRCLDRMARRQKILLLYAGAPEFADLYVKYGIEPCVFDPWWIENALRHRSKLAEPLRIHLWIDVGTAREGILPTDIAKILPLLDQGGILVEGVATHFSAVTRDHAIQKSRFDQALQMLAEGKIHPRLVHAVASHNGLGYNDLTGRLSPHKADRDLQYDMVRPGCALGLGPRWRLDDPNGEVLRIEIPIREARIAHIKDIPAGWNLGYWENKFDSRTRIAVLEGTRLSSLRYESFLADPADESRLLRSVMSHGSIAAIDLAEGEWHVGDALKCHTVMWLSFFTRSFERTADGYCLAAACDAASGKTSRLRVAVSKQSREHLRLNIERSLNLALNFRLESVGRKRRLAWFANELLTRSFFRVLVVAEKIPRFGRKLNSIVAPINCS